MSEKIYLRDHILATVKEAMGEERLSRESVANMMRVHVSYINMLFAPSSFSRIPKYFYTMIVDWMDSGHPMRKWFMELCDFDQYEKKKQKRKKPVKKKALPLPAPEEINEMDRRSRHLASLEHQEKPFGAEKGNNSPIQEPTTTNAEEPPIPKTSPAMDLLKFIHENRIQAEISITIKSSI